MLWRLAHPYALGRPESRAVLVALTVTHQLGAAIWIGGLVQLAALWRLARRDPDLDAAWPELVRRSGLATAAVVVLVLSAIPLTWSYVEAGRASPAPATARFFSRDCCWRWCSGWAH